MLLVQALHSPCCTKKQIRPLQNICQFRFSIYSSTEAAVQMASTLAVRQFLEL